MAESVRKLTGNKAALRVVLDMVSGDPLNRVHRIDREDGNRGTDNIPAVVIKPAWPSMTIFRFSP